MALTAKKVYAILKRQISDMEAKLNSPVRYRGTVATADLLPLNPDIGDMYNIESKSVYGEAGMNVAWNGVVWDTMGAPIDMSLYFTKEEAEAVIQRLVAEYFEKNPVRPGATTEQAQQIEQNKTDIASLKEDISTKITKFYASNQGETHITDSDNGKIQDMMLYGKSSQNGTPTPEKPVEIKSVVNPTVKVCGKNLWNPILGGYINGNDGSITEGSKTQSAVTDFIKTSGKDITVIARNFSSAIEISYAYRIGFYNAEKKWIKNIFPSGGNKYSINTLNITGTEYIRVSAPSGIYDTIQIEKGSEATSYEPYTEQSVQLPYTLNAIPVTSGGNVTIDGQQYIADYVDVEHGKVIRNILKWRLGDFKYGFNNAVWHINISELGIDGSKIGLSNMFKIQNGNYNGVTASEFYIAYDGKAASLNMRGMTDEEFKKWLREKNPEVYNVLTVAEEIPITLEEASAFKQLMTYYPVTNISVNSEQLDGLTVFNYPISMANGWNYVKQQLNDNRDYIYDMDLQSAEAYVNSEYAVALTELEV